MALKLVPFNDSWITHEKIDVHAIYRRPRFIEDTYGEMQREYDKAGRPTWDLTGPLPVRQHNKWRAKGFEYVTLANRESLNVAARFGTLPPGHPTSEYDQHQTGGPWSYRKYAEGADAVTTLESEQLLQDVQEFGADVVERIRRRTDPTFQLPEHMRGTKAKDAAESTNRKNAKNAEVA